MKKRALILVIINLFVWIILPFIIIFAGINMPIGMAGVSPSNTRPYDDSRTRSYVKEELSMAANEAAEKYYVNMLNNKEYRKSEPYFEKGSKKVIKSADVFFTNCPGAREGNSDEVEITIIKIIDKNGMEIKEESQIINYKENEGYIVGYYKYVSRDLYYGFIIDVSNYLRVSVSEKGAKTNEETLLESEQEEKILYPTVDSFDN